jgi:cbb3-type cytochrome oxidase maturation protein
MEILYLLIPLGLGLVVLAGLALVWAFANGQYDQLEALQQRMPDDSP